MRYHRLPQPPLRMAQQRAAHFHYPSFPVVCRCGHVLSSELFEIHHQLGKESLEARTRGSRNRQDVVAMRAKEVLYLWPTLLGDGEIQLGGNDDLWPLC